MIRSMTGFGRFEAVTPEHKITAEMKAVNHRYLDLSMKMPKKFNYFEAGLRNLLKNYIQRGKVDVFISYEDYTEEKLCLKYNSTLASEYMEYFEKMQRQFGIEYDIKVSTLARMPEVLTMEQAPEDEEQVWRLLSEAMEEAAKRFVEARLQEGERLKADLIGKLDYKVKELLENSLIDEGRIAAEVTLYADKICVDEELVRLRSHIHATRKELENGGSV